MNHQNLTFSNTTSIKQKILTLVIAVAVIATASALAFSIKGIRDGLIKENQLKVSYATEMAYNVVKSYKEKADKGELTVAQAKQLAAQDVAAMRYDGKNYIWVNDYNYNFLAHPTLNGKSGSGLIDKNGVKVVVDGTTLARDKGEGFVEYQWTKATENPSKTFPKISHVRNFPEWGWVFGTGVYIDDIDKSVMNVFWQISIATILILSVVIIVVLATVLKDIVNSMTLITTDLDSSSSQIAAASNQLESASQRLAEASTEQASAIQETSATLEETSSMVRQNNQNTEQAAKLAQQTKLCADSSNKGMETMMKAMEEIKKSSNEISKIIKVIDDIAFQTNILALNAAVEAARAGDAGLGFAVVAEEVRNLAQRSTQAAKDTTNIIESNISLSDEGSNIAQKVYGSISEIDMQAKKVSELIDEIAAATNEQSQGIEQIHKAISQMESVLQSNAQTADESAAASQELFAQTLSMNSIVGRLTEFVKGSQGHIQSPTYSSPKLAYNNSQNRRIANKRPMRNNSPEDIIPLGDF